MTQPAAEQVSPVQAGEVIGGKYRVERILGIGGMGVVVAATHLQLDQKVALKFLRHDAKDNTEVVERFTREARAAVRIQSEHVGRVMDVGQLDNGDLFIVMEYLEGRDLSDILEVDGPLPVSRAVEYVLQACEALGEAHANGIIHRDLKPANLFLARRVDGTRIIKVLDFGISKLTLSRLDAKLASNPKLTHPTAVMGSPLYMSPEQMHSSVHVDARSDIWGLGVILYEMVSGQTPFEDESIPLIHAAILHNPPPPLKEKVPNLPPRFEAILFKCLEKDPAKRYADVAELATALAPVSPKQGRITKEKLARLQKAIRISERPAGVVVPPDPTAPASTITSWGEGKRRSGWSSTSIVLLLLLLGAAAAAAGFVVRRGNPLAAWMPTTSSGTPAPTPAVTEMPAPAPTQTAVATEPAPPPETPAPQEIASAAAASGARGQTPPLRPPVRPPRRPPPASKASAAPSAAPSDPPKPPPAPASTDGTNGFGDRE